MMHVARKPTAARVEEKKATARDYWLSNRLCNKGELSDGRGVG